MRLTKTTTIGLILIVVSSLLLVTPPAAEASETIEVVALGDSYTSGTGALDYEDRDCWRSPNAYVHQFAHKLSNNGFPATSINFACHGDLTSDISGQITNTGSSLANADIVLLTIGGNDANFKEIAKWCLSFARSLDPCRKHIDQANADFDLIISRVRSVIVQIANAAPSAQIVLVGYPYLVEACRDEYNVVRSLVSAVEAHYSLTINDLDQIPLITAGRVNYASMLSAFAGGGVCGDGPQLIRGSFDTFLSNYLEWWHPNVEGHAKIAEELFAHRADYGIGATTTTPTSPPPPTSTGTKYTYGNLPFACGAVVPRATTYQSYNYNGTIYSHGYAIDLPMVSGTKVVSPANGRAYVKWDQYGYGRYIDVVDANGITHRMAHMRTSVKVSNGATVSQGQLIGYVGVTGATTGAHLHYEQRLGGVQRQVKLSGPALVWSQPYGASGDRHTLHKLKSSNCSNSNPVWGGVGSGAKYKGSALLKPGQALYPNEYILSGNVRAVMIFRSNGNLVLAADGKVVWQSYTKGSGATKAVMQGDGNFVLYAAGGRVVWTTYNDKNPPTSPRQSGSWLQIQNDGNVVIYYPNGGYLWHTHTDGKVRTPTTTYKGSKLMPGKYLVKNQYLRSSDKRYAFLFQADGNLVLFGPGYKVLWHAATHNTGAKKFVMQGDGNLVAYKTGGWVWQSCSSGNSGKGLWLNLQNDGNLVVYNKTASRHYWDRFSTPNACWK